MRLENKGLEAEDSSSTLSTRSRNLDVALARQINEEWSSYQALSSEVVDLALQIENGRIRIGTLLEKAKASVPHGTFMAWVKQHCPNISHRTATTFISAAKAADFQPIKSLDDLREYQILLVRLGIREAPAGHGPQTLHDRNPFSVAVRSVGTVRQHLDLLLEVRPLDQWSDEDKTSIKAQLEPVVAFYNGL